MATYTTIDGLLHVETAVGVYAPATVPLMVDGGFLVKLTADQVAVLTPPDPLPFPGDYPLPLAQVTELRSITTLPAITLVGGQSINAVIEWGSSATSNPGVGVYGWMGGILASLGTLAGRLPATLAGDRLKVDADIDNTTLEGLVTAVRDRLPLTLEGDRLKVDVEGSLTGGLTDAELRATPVPVTGGLTDTQLRSSAVPISGTVNLGTLGTAATATLQRFTPVTIGTVTTSDTGANWVALADHAGRYVDFQNTSEHDLEYQRGGAGNSMRIPASSGRVIPVSANANELSVRRVDTDNAQITCSYEVVS